jgi:hypothetical protein
MEKKLGWKLGTTLVTDANIKSMSIVMIAVGLAVVAGLCYWFEWYQLAFWILVYAMVYGVLGALRAMLKASDVSRGLWRPGQGRSFASSLTFATNSAPDPKIAVNAAARGPGGSASGLSAATARAVIIPKQASLTRSTAATRPGF